MTNYDLFSPLLSIVTFQEMTIKHLMYTPKVPFLYTERPCVLFSGFGICLGNILCQQKCSYYFRPEGVENIQFDIELFNIRNSTINNI